MPDAFDLDAFLADAAASGGAERANAQTFLADLARALGVDPPHLTTGDAAADGYVYERPLAFRDGRQSKGFIDLYKRGHFVLETKQGADAKRTEGGAKLRQGHGRRGTRAWEQTMDAARFQAEGYARNLEAAEPPPPFIVVCDVGYCLDLYADFSGSGRLYAPYPDAAHSRIPLERLRDDGVREMLAAVFQDPLSLDPARRQARVTVELADALAGLAAGLSDARTPDGQRLDAEAVGGFLSRALFCMFAEDAGLIPESAFTRLLDAYSDDLDALPHALTDFFDTMDRGGFVGEVRAQLRRFNGQLFKDTRAPVLDAGQRQALADAARADWSDVEPSIFGTLLERALDPTERHRLGAHFTPRATVERLVGPTVLEPLREQWAGVRAAAQQTLEAAEAATGATRTRRRNEARKLLSDFLTRLATVTVLDPACGSGNFLYVTFAGLKALEDEVRRTTERLVGESVGEGFGVTPRQMRGIELNARAAAIADLVLWIGYLQWHRKRYDGAQPLPEPVLEGYGQVEHRDAVLADGAPAPWPDADFIVGNPPFLGASRMREALGDAYAEALRAAYPDVPESADVVMYWWHRAADAVRRGDATRFGLVTTNSLTQTFNRRIVERHLGGADLDPRLGDVPEDAPPLALAFAVPDHPWVDTADGAAVRVAMTVGARADTVAPAAGRLNVVTDERPSKTGIADVVLAEFVGEIHADLTVGADVTQAESMEANAGIADRGVQLYGAGFLLSAGDAEDLGYTVSPSPSSRIRPYRNGRDMMQTSRGLFVIDLFGLSEEDARLEEPRLFEHLIRTVKPSRDKSNEKRVSENWWLHGRPRDQMREATSGLRRFIATVETAKHRTFHFLDASILPDNMLVNIASDDAFHLGVLSSRTHVEWALAAGGTLEDRPRYNKSKCFEPFPFPAATPEQAADVRRLGEALDAHRAARQAEHPDLRLTDLYNAVEALRAGRALTQKEQRSADAGLAWTLLALHRELDAAVLAAYGWQDLDAQVPSFRASVLDRLVSLNAERHAEERAGLVRWLRPSFQAPDAAPQRGLVLPSAARVESAPERRAWPAALPERVVAVRQAVAAGAGDAASVAERFVGARTSEAAEVLETLAELGLVSARDGVYAG